MSPSSELRGGLGLGRLPPSSPGAGAGEQGPRPGIDLPFLSAPAFQVAVSIPLRLVAFVPPIGGARAYRLLSVDPRFALQPGSLEMSLPAPLATAF